MDVKVPSVLELSRSNCKQNNQSERKATWQLKIGFLLTRVKMCHQL